MTVSEQILIDKILRLPAPRLAEVETFVDFLRSRDLDSDLVASASKSSEGSFAAVWDNDEDAAYDRL